MNDDKKILRVVNVSITANLTREDVDDIMSGALDGGITYWADRVEVVGDYMAQYASEQISRGGELLIHDVEAEQSYYFTLDMFIKGFKLWLQHGNDIHRAVSDGKVDTCNIDAGDCDAIIQYALFGEIIYA